MKTKSFSRKKRQQKVSCYQRTAASGKTAAIQHVSLPISIAFHP